MKINEEIKKVKDELSKLECDLELMYADVWNEKDKQMHLQLSRSIEQIRNYVAFQKGYLKALNKIKKLILNNKEVVL
jgi:hypothetical protein